MTDLETLEKWADLRRGLRNMAGIAQSLNISIDAFVSEQTEENQKVVERLITELCFYQQYLDEQILLGMLGEAKVLLPRLKTLNQLLLNR